MNLLEVPDRVIAWFHRLSPNLGDTIADVATIAGVVAVCASAVFLTWREIMIARALQPHRRGRYLVRSTRTNEWSKEELARWGAHLAMIRRRVRRFQDRPAHAVRIRLAATRNGVAFMIEGSWRLEKVMRNPLLPGVVITRLRPRAQPDASGSDPDASPATPTRS